MADPDTGKIDIIALENKLTSLLKEIKEEIIRQNTDENLNNIENRFTVLEKYINELLQAVNIFKNQQANQPKLPHMSISKMSSTSNKLIEDLEKEKDEILKRINQITSVKGKLTIKIMTDFTEKLFSAFNKTYLRIRRYNDLNPN